jgi:hypothetical protein
MFLKKLKIISLIKRETEREVATKSVQFFQVNQSFLTSEI